jgi:hypothetical protein
MAATISLGLGAELETVRPFGGFYLLSVLSGGFIRLAADNESG